MKKFTFTCCRCGDSFTSSAYNAKRCKAVECQRSLTWRGHPVSCAHCGCEFYSKAHNAMWCKATECQRASGRKRKRYARAANTEADKMYLLEWRKRSREKVMLVSVRSRAKKYGIEFSLKESDLKIPKYCPVLGIELGWSEGYAKAQSPSVDRIDPTKGYTPDNIMIISWRANRLKSDAEPHELQAVLRYVMKHYKTQESVTSEEAGAK
jgi:hypothetical protein